MRSAWCPLTHGLGDQYRFTPCALDSNRVVILGGANFSETSRYLRRYIAPVPTPAGLPKPIPPVSWFCCAGIFALRWLIVMDDGLIGLFENACIILLLLEKVR